MKIQLGKTFKNPTVFSILGTLIILIGLPIGFIGLTLKGGASLGGAIILLGLSIIILVVFLDRIFVNEKNRKLINGIELTLLFFGITYFTYTERQIIIDLKNIETNYFVVLENDGTLYNSNLHYIFPFDRKMEFNKNLGIINSINDNYQRLKLKSPREWNSQKIQPWKTNKYKIRFYSNGDLSLTKNEIDSLIKIELNKVTKYVDD